MKEKNVSGGFCKLGISSILPQDKGSKNKRKLDDPCLENPIILPLSMSKFPPHVIAPRIFEPLKVGSSMRSLSEDFEPANWDDPIACQLEEFLLSNLYTVFRNAIKKVVECGFKEDVAEKAISRHSLYQGGKDLLSNVVNDAIASLKEGIEGDISDDLFEDLQQLVVYTMLEMISVLREVKPCLTIAEAMWWLLVFDLNISGACEMEGDMLRNLGCIEVSGERSANSNAKAGPETQTPETSLPNSKEPNVSKPSLSSQNHQPEALKFGNLPNLPKHKSSLAREGMTKEKEFSISTSASRDVVSVASVSEEKEGTGRKGHSKKELAALQKKSLLEINKVYSKGYRSGKISASGSFVVEKRMKSPSELPAVPMKKSSSNMVTGAGALADERHRSLANSLSRVVVADNSSKLPMKGTKSAVPTTKLGVAPSSSLENKPVAESGGTSKSYNKTPERDAEKKPAPKAEGASVSSKSIDYYAGIPYDKSLGKYIPRDEKDELILKFVPAIEELQSELEGWTKWANQKIMQAARRLGKDQAELKSLRQEKEEAEQLKREKQIMEENTMKRLSEMEFALNNAISQVADANSTVKKLEVEQSMLNMEMKVAKSQATSSAASCREALEREQKALKDVQSWEVQRSLLQEELGSEKQKEAELQRKISKAKNTHSQIEMTWKEERKANEKFLAQAASIRKERERREAVAKVEENKIKVKAEKDMQKYQEEIKKLESKLSELKAKLDSSKIAALRGGIDGGKGQCSSVNEGNHNPSFSKRAVDIKDYSGTRGLKQEHECVMCLSEEKTVIFLPCAHQVLCVKCNELHEKQHMEDCPACRTLIGCRICARFAKPQP